MKNALLTMNAALVGAKVVCLKEDVMIGEPPIWENQDWHKMKDQFNHSYPCQHAHTTIIIAISDLAVSHMAHMDSTNALQLSIHANVIMFTAMDISASEMIG